MLKKLPFLAKLQKADVPAYEILSLALGIAGAFAMGIPNAIVAGIVAGLAAGKGYDFATGNGEKKLPDIAKTVVPILLLGCLLFAGCGEKQMAVQPAAWLLSGANTSAADGENEVEDSLEYLGRVGVQSGQTEFGATSSWWMGTNPRQNYGIYIIQFISPDPNGILGTQPYAGVQASLDVEDDDGGLYGFMVGTIVPVSGLDVVTEFQMLNYNEALDQSMTNEDEKRLFVGLRFKF